MRGDGHGESWSRAVYMCTVTAHWWVVLHERQICQNRSLRLGSNKHQVPRNCTATMTDPVISEQDPNAYVGEACDAKSHCCRPWCARGEDHAKDAPVNARHAASSPRLVVGSALIISHCQYSLFHHLAVLLRALKLSIQNSVSSRINPQQFLLARIARWTHDKDKA